MKFTLILLQRTGEISLILLFVSSSESWFFHVGPYGFIDVICVFFLKVELYSHHTWTSSHGRPLLLCHWKHHGGVWRVLGSAANVRSCSVVTLFPKARGKTRECQCVSVTPGVGSFLVNLNLYLSSIVVPIRSNEVWVLDLEQWSWSKPPIAGPSPHPRGGQSQVRRLQRGVAPPAWCFISES